MKMTCLVHASMHIRVCESVDQWAGQQWVLGQVMNHAVSVNAVYQMVSLEQILYQKLFYVPLV